MNKKNIVMHSVVSGNVKEIGFGAALGPKKSNVLRVTFNRGRTYDYWPVSIEMFLAGLSAPSVNDWLNQVKNIPNIKVKEII